jgi:hypothetical protein
MIVGGPRRGLEERGTQTSFELRVTSFEFFHLSTRNPEPETRN